MKTIQWQSKEYFDGIKLRNKNLNKPSGLAPITRAPIQEEWAIHLVATIHGKVVGTLFIDNTDGYSIAQIKQVAVSSDYQGRKIGQHLMYYAELIARQQGYDEIILNARDSAWGFYEQLGYVPFGETYPSAAMSMQPYKKTIRQAESALVGVA